MAWYRNKKQIVENLISLSIKDLSKNVGFQQNINKKGLMFWGGDSVKTASASICFNLSTFECRKYLTVKYTYDDEKLEYPIILETTSPNYGGERWWFKCPCCGRRVSKLYIKNRLFECRKCNDLTYKSQQYSFYDRMRLMANRYENKAKEDGVKRKGMHWSTYNSLMDKSNEYDDYAFIPVLKYLAKFVK